MSRLLKTICSRPRLMWRLRGSVLSFSALGDTGRLECWVASSHWLRPRGLRAGCCPGRGLAHVGGGLGPEAVKAQPTGKSRGGHWGESRTPAGGSHRCCCYCCCCCFGTNHRAPWGRGRGLGGETGTGVPGRLFFPVLFPPLLREQKMLERRLGTVPSALLGGGSTWRASLPRMFSFQLSKGVGWLRRGQRGPCVHTRSGGWEASEMERWSCHSGPGGRLTGREPPGSPGSGGRFFARPSVCGLRATSRRCVADPGAHPGGHVLTRAPQGVTEGPPRVVTPGPVATGSGQVPRAAARPECHAGRVPRLGSGSSGARRGCA